ncbi:MAG: methylaspartate mutase accessory protein GlmL [Hyphomicrobiales bacterium]
MSLHLTVDFGSTYTKAVLFDLAAEKVVAVGYSPSTVGEDVREGLRAALKQLGGAHDLKAIPCLACSSAAGGLRMVTIGLVPSLSLEAARRAALGAGAKVVGAFGYKLTAADLDEIRSQKPDILLLAGGTDGGDEENIQFNAGQIGKLGLAIPVIVAGNRAAVAECEAILASANVEAIVTPNILPEVDKLNVEPVHAEIRRIFMDRIVHAKGIDKVGEELDLSGPIVPTPRAILDAAQLLSEGSGREKGVGDVVVIDIGGATTDIHSIASGAPRTPGVVPRGLPELRAKRTVEGDLGMRVNAPTVLQRVGPDAIVDMCRSIGGFDCVNAATVQSYVERVGEDTSFVPTEREELAIDAAIAGCAAQLAMIRHAGHLREVYTPNGTVLVQEGKDLTGTRMLIGVGGVVAHGRYARPIMEAAFWSNARPMSLCPRSPELFVDRHYVLFGVGLLSRHFPLPALAIGRSELLPV